MSTVKQKRKSARAAAAKTATAEPLQARSPLTGSLVGDSGSAAVLTDQRDNGLSQLPRDGEAGANIQVLGAVDIDAMKRTAVSAYKAQASAGLQAAQQKATASAAVVEELRARLQRLANGYGERLGQRAVDSVSALLGQYDEAGTALRHAVSAQLPGRLANENDDDEVPHSYVRYTIEIIKAGADRYNNVLLTLKKSVSVTLLDGAADLLKEAEAAAEIAKADADEVLRWRRKYDETPRLAERVDAQISRAILERTATGQALLKIIDMQVAEEISR